MKFSKIVVIDDEEDILELIRYNLEKERATVETFTSGQEALKIIQQSAPDLIISDWMMGDIDGLDLCRVLKRDPLLSQIPFVMLTARGDEIDAVTALELGADEYLVKPIRMRELITRIRKIIDRSSAAKPAMPMAVLIPQLPASTPPQIASDKLLCFKDLVMNIENHQVSIESNELALTYTEFRLLQLLISRQGRVYSRNQIMEKLNGIDYFATERSIDVQVAGLRKKLGPYKDYLETVRGVGYRMQE
ncbi:response regulator transcription factor [Spirosoma arcticum]